MIFVADSSPLISLARIDCFDLLQGLFGKIYISQEFFDEVSIAGSGLPGAEQVSGADWIEVKSVQNTSGVAAAILQTGLGAGEISTIFLARELSANLVLMDERRARRYAVAKGFNVIGCIGILETLYEKGRLADLREIYAQLLDHKTRVDLKTLAQSLAKFHLEPL